MTPNDLLQWYYLIYALPGAAAMLFLLMSAAGGARHHRAAAGGQHGGAHHGGGGLRHASHSGGRHAPSSHSGNGKAPQSGRAAKQAPNSAGLAFLSFFGFGRLPSTFVWGSILIGWGLFGLIATRWGAQTLRYPALFVLPAAGAAVVGALLSARTMAFLGSRLMPQDGSSATSTVELCGLTGTVAFPVDSVRGRVFVYDSYGTLHDVQARLNAGTDALPKGAKVLLVDYDAAADRVVVESEA